MSKSKNPHPERALPHVVTALIAKRAELAGRIKHLQAEVVAVTVKLDRIESTLRIFKSDIDIEEVTPRPVPSAHHAFREEVSRTLLEGLWKADRPLSTTELIERIMNERGLNMKDAKLRQVMGCRIGAYLLVCNSVPYLKGRRTLMERYRSAQSSTLLLNWSRRGRSSSAWAP